ncbi:MAG: hypothetical protein ACYC35_16885 [Pirellulales bacterium]
MRVLFAIPHFCQATKSQLFGSLQGNRDARIRSLRDCLASLGETFGERNYLAHLAAPVNVRANEQTSVELQIVVCTTGGAHVLPDQPIPRDRYVHQAVDCEPRFLGYECHAILRDRLGQFDFYCYLEDDLVVRDPWLFAKLQWFTAHAGEDCLLQPNRFEALADGSGWKAYIDGDLPPESTARYQDVSQAPELRLDYLGAPIVFRRPLNPHAGCFFLNTVQMEQWAKQPYFLDRDASFYSPLEGAATVGIMRTFKVYKPTAAVANFLEVQHAGDAWMKKIARRNANAKRGARLETG